MLDPSLAIQKAVVARLRDEVGSFVYDLVPPSDPYPRIVVGEQSASSDFQDCRWGMDTTISIDVWTRSVGYPEAKTLASEVRDALNDQILDLDGHVMDMMRFETTRYMRDPDGITSRASMQFRILSQPDDGTRVATGTARGRGTATGSFAPIISKVGTAHGNGIGVATGPNVEPLQGLASGLGTASATQLAFTIFKGTAAGLGSALGDITSISGPIVIIPTPQPPNPYATQAVADDSQSDLLPLLINA